jgi:branched-chain amino acid transport system permease protein
MGYFFPAGQYTISLDFLPPSTVSIGGARITDSSLVLSLFALVLALAVVAFVRFTHAGTLLRAAGQDPVLASRSGIPVNLIYLLSWAAAAVLAAIAGISYASGSVVNYSMVSLGLAALPAIVLGGLDSIEGAVIGGVIIGMVQSFTQTYLGGDYVYLITYGLLLVALLAYPEGILGTKQIVRA